MKKIHSFLICFLLALTASAPLATLGGNNFTTAYADGENEITISSKSELEQIAKNVNDGTDNYAGKTITLTRDIDLGTWTPIGTESAPFKGVFDGNGHTLSNVTIDDSITYQGLFGCTNGATIKNLCIKDFSSNSLQSASGVYVGAILGAGKNTTIEYCEIDASVNSEVEYMIQYTTTIGSVAGRLDGSIVLYTSSFVKIDAVYDLLNYYTVEAGGFVGSAENTKFEKVSSFGGVNITYGGEAEKLSLSSKFLVGGFAGELSGDKMIMHDCVVGGNVNVEQIETEDDVTQTINKGAVAGVLVNTLSNGSLASIAYTSSVSAFGQNEANYQLSNNYVMQVPTGAIKSQGFYEDSRFTFELGGYNYTFVWYEGTEIWDFDNKWVMADDQLRLQLFQYFDVALADFLDENALLKAVSSNQTSVDGRKPYSHNQLVSMSVCFKDEVNNNYYDISDISHNGKSLNLSEFEESETEIGTVKTSKNGDVTFYKKDGIYYVDVRANNSTDGSYSFKLEAIKYRTYFVSDENGSVCYSGSSNLSSVLSRDMSASSNAISVEAVPNKKYKFNGWSIYYQNDIAGDIEYDGKIWKRQAASLSGSNPLKIIFADNPFTQSFLLMANFIYDPCTISFAFDSTMITKIVVNTDVISSSSDQATLDKNEMATIKVYVKQDVDFDSDELAEKIKSYFSRETNAIKSNSYKDELDTTQTIYEYSFMTSSLNYDSSSEFSFTLSTKIIEDDTDQNLTLYIIIGSVGGGVLLIGGGVTIWLVRRKKAYGGTAKTKDEDYKNFYY